MPSSSQIRLTRDERLQAVIADCLEQIERGEALETLDYASAHPDLAADVAEFLADWQRFRYVADAVSPTAGGPAATGAPLLPRRLGDYELLEAIAQGGMGIVYKARQLPLQRIVAVKMLLAGTWATPDDVKRFLSEAAAAAQLDHPGIVPIYETGEHDGLLFFSMAYVPGESLAECVADGPLPPAEAARIVRDVALAVQYAHEHGVIHRDLKPANILMENRAPRITDFGLARWGTDDNRCTRTGELVGTPGYMAPEQATPRAGSIGPATDVYALGALLYCLLTGRAPFQSAHPLDTLRQVCEQEPVPLSRFNPLVPLDLETIALHCLQKLPGRRYATAQDVADELTRFLENRPIRTRPAGVVERTIRWGARRPLVATLAALVAVSLIGGFAISTYFAVLANQRAAGERSRREELERALYRSRIMQADLEWQNDNVARADRLLDDCPAQLRNWEWGCLKRKCHAERVTCVGHSGSVRGVCYRSDGAALLSAGQDQTVRMWDAQSGAQQARWDFSASVMAIAFLADGNAACALLDGSVIVWNVESGQRRFQVRPASDEIFDLAADRSGRWLATADEEGTIRVISAKEGTIRAVLQHDQRPARVVAFDEAGVLASAGDDELVRLWNWEENRRLATLTGHTGSVRALAFLPGKKQLLSSGDDGTVRLWDTEKGVALDVWETHDSPVWSLALSPRGDRVASAGEAGSVVMQELDTGAQIRIWKGHHLLVYGMAFRPDGRELASSGMDGRINLWEVDSPPYVPMSSGHEARVNEIACSFDGRQIASAAKDGTVRLWDSVRADPIATITTGVSNLSVAFAEEANGLVIGGEDGLVRLCRSDAPGECASLTGHVGPVWSVAAAKGQIASAGQDGTVRLWDAAAHREFQTLHGHTAAVKCVRFSPDGRLLATCGDDEQIRVWDAESGAELGILSGHAGKVWSVSFSAGGDRLVSSGSDGFARVWDMNTRQLRLICGPHSGIAYSAVFTPDGTRIATGGFDRTVKLWDATTGAEVLTLHGHIWSVNSVAVMPDGMSIVSGSSDTRVRLWHAVPWQ